MGGPRVVEAYYKAYKYIIDNYNIDDKIYVAGASMGGLSAVNFVNTYPDLCIACGLQFPVTDLYNQAWLNPWSEKTRSRIAEEYNFDDENIWEESKIKGLNPINSDFPIPLKIWHGDNDSIVNHEGSIDFVNRINEKGGTASIDIIEGKGHGFYSWDKWTEYYNAECIKFFKKYDY